MLGAEALGWDDKSKYRAVVTDISLLGTIDGWEVGRSAREIDPTIPIIYMTGTHREEWASKGVPNSLLLAKPFAAAQIVIAISQLLNATPPVPPAEQRAGLMARKLKPRWASSTRPRGRAGRIAKRSQAANARWKKHKLDLAVRRVRK